MTGQPLLHLSHVSRHYETGDVVVKALDDISLSIWPGEFVAIMGQSGSGKTTLMNLIGCLDQPTGGEYTVNGHPAAELERDELAALRRETFGFVFQRYNLLGTATAQENVEIPAIYAGMPKKKRAERAREILGRLGLADRCDHRPGKLSGGQQQRVAIARALMNDPPVVLADEPTGALDSRSGEEVMTLLKQLHAEGRTIILITHDANVAAHAQRVIRIQDGHITEDNDPEGKLERSAQKAVIKPRGSEDIGTSGQEAIKTAFRALHANIFRTALTLLGIVIGVAAVITMLAVGNGSKQKVLDQISTLGTNLLNIRPGAQGIRSSGDIATMTRDDAKEIENIPNVVVVVPERQGHKTVRVGSLDYATTVQGEGPGFPVARDWDVALGSFFTQRDVDTYAPVIVLGKTVSDTLFPGVANPLGQFVLVGNIPFEVIGIMSAKGAAPWGGDQDDAVFVPVSTGMIRLFGGNYINSITVKVADTDQIDATEDAIRTLLIARHNTEDFSVRNTASFLEMATETQNTLTLLLGAVAAISLLVGGIGVMNIMLVSVTERTREIGIRMATGARIRDILLQFNIEAAVVCTIGGVMGVLIGLGLGGVLSLFGMEIYFSAAPIITAFSSAVLTGLVFGYLPARKAAHLDPVVALSSE